VAAYHDIFRMFLDYLDQHCHKRPSQLSLDDFDARLTLDFQDFLEAERGNGIRSRNARLADLRLLDRLAAQGERLSLTHVPP